MKRNLIRTTLSLCALLICLLQTPQAISQNSYFTQFYSPGTGNPAQANQQQDFDQTGWVQITAGTQMANSWSSPQAVPFSFNYFGQAVNQFKVSQNGLVTFDTSTTILPVANNTNLPSDSLPPLTIACFWDAFTSAPPTGGNDQIEIQTFGLAPNRQFWIRWYSFEMGNPSADFNYFACILMETSNKVLLLDMGYHAAAQNLTSTGGLQLNDSTAVQYGDSTLGLIAGTSSDVDNVWYEFCPYVPIPVNISMEEIMSPVSACGLTNAEAIGIKLQNLGTDTVFSVPVCFQVDGTGGDCDTILATIPPLGFYSYTFDSTGNFATSGNHSLKAWSYHPLDSDQVNDTLDITVNNVLPISSFPYLQDFDSWTKDLFEPVPLNSGWENIQGEGPQDWWINDAGTATGNTGPLSDHTSGSGKYLYMEDSNNDNDSVDLKTPCFDLAGKNICAGFWVHSIEANGGVSNVNELYVQVWDGSSWTTIDTIGHIGGGWTFLQYNLLAFINKIISIRLRGNNNNSSIFHDIAIDDFQLWEKVPVNVSVASIEKPAESSCGIGTEQVCIYVTNTGSNATSGSFPVTYAVGADTVTEMVSSILNPQDTILFCFSVPANLTAVGNYTLYAWTSMTGDTILGDDTASVVLSHKPLVNTFPYLEDFESGTGYWEDDGINNSWAFGTPAKNEIVGAASGAKAWMTGGTSGIYNNTETSWVTGPCFDFTGLTNPYFQAKVWWNCESGFDGAAVQYSIDTGNTWQHLGAFGDPNVWYNEAAVNSLVNFVGDGNGWTGRDNDTLSSEAWMCVNKGMASLAGNPLVQFRFIFASDGTISDDGFAFDDIYITEGPPIAVNIGPDTSLCDTNYLLTTGIPSANFLWSNGQVTPATNVDSTGNYWVRVTGQNGLCSYDSADVVLLGLPVVDIGIDTTICTGDTILLDAANPNEGILWNTGDTTQTIVVDTTGDYAVTVTNVFGCAVTDSIFVLRLDTVIANVGPDTSLCAAFYQINAGIPLQKYQWSNGDSTESIFASSSGTYYVDITSICGTGTDTMDLVLLPIPSVDLGGDQTVCDSTTLDAGNAGSSFLWSTGDTAQTIVANSSTTYWAEVTNSDGCINSDSILVFIQKAPVAGISADISACPIVTFQEIQVGGQSTNWAWDFGDGGTSTLQNPTYTYNADSTYTVTLTAQNFCGTDVGTKLVTIACLINRSEAHANARLILYPNPSDRNFKIDFVDMSIGNLTEGKISIRNLQGQQFYSSGTDQVVANDWKVSTACLPAGLYLLELVFEQVQFHSKFEVIH